MQTASTPTTDLPTKASHVETPNIVAGQLEPTTEGLVQTTPTALNIQPEVSSSVEKAIDLPGTSTATLYVSPARVTPTVPAKEVNMSGDASSETVKTDCKDTTGVNVETVPVVKAEHDPITTDKEGIVLSQYPWKRSVQLQLVKLSDITVDIWCNCVSDYYVHVPEIEAKPVIVCGYGQKRENVDRVPDNAKQIKSKVPVETDSAVDTDIGNLLTHAENLVQQAKTLVGHSETKEKKKTTTARNKKTKSSKQQGSLHVEIEPTPSAIDLLHQQTITKLTPEGPVPQGVKCERSVRCRLCDCTFPKVRD